MKLGVLIKLRENNRDQRRHALAEAETKEENFRVRIAAINAELKINREKWLTATSQLPVDLETLKVLQTRREELKRSRKEMESALVLAKQETDGARLSLSEAVRDVKVLENLKERTEREGGSS